MLSMHKNGLRVNPDLARILERKTTAPAAKAAAPSPAQNAAAARELVEAAKVAGLSLIHISEPTRPY